MALSARRLLLYIVFVAVCLLLGNILMLSMHPGRNPSMDAASQTLLKKLIVLNTKAKDQAEQQSQLQVELLQLNDKINTAKRKKAEERAVPIIHQPDEHVAIGGESVEGGDTSVGGLVLPILVFACNRPTAITQALNDLIKYRSSKEKFPIIVTQDCAHEETKAAIQNFKDDISAHILQPDTSSIQGLTKKEKKLEGYFKISRHYKWAFGQVFDVMKYKAVIIMEDDLNISPDFYEYFEATYALLRDDSSLYCVSAWNDNGKAKHIEDNPDLLYRSDFFPGLGWMMLGTLWDEYRDKWPKGFWDDWVRQEPQRKGRSCIRPEISRTHTFGEKGVSLGLFYKTHLKFMILNEKMVEWTKKDLSYLKKDKYDEMFMKQVQDAPLINLNGFAEVAKNKQHASVRIQYTDKSSFKLIAKTLDIMNDFKDGMPRTAYRGVVTIYREGVRIYLAPPRTWEKYDPSWT